MTKHHLLGQLVQRKERECETLIVYFEGDITFSFIGNKCFISGPNFHTAWEQSCFVFRMQAVVGYDTLASTRKP